ncbi:hypothetical protein BDV95DRAFT_480223 [Massariosphaeria phaeospora]|uniref:N-acetyltransferase domain-containing protein n=1 Tax=Massariosphaeria phaeospora TaxID=100035 RepID=A0A7C8IQQ0_9PLEO|nr:hypothetical protein BDV95DRAFT_480223 [Massariosphaeria phaeospora]
MPDPNLTVSLLTPDEAPQYMFIRHETFRPTINKILYPRGEPSAATLARVTSDIRTGITNDGILYLKCVDSTPNPNPDTSSPPSPPLIIAGARWRSVPASSPTLPIPPPYPESDPALFRHFYALFNDAKTTHLGGCAYFALDTLVTLAGHQRRGAGGRLVEWGVRRADEAGVQCWVEASPMGEGLYKRWGFERVAEVGVDLGEWGVGEGELRFVVSCVWFSFLFYVVWFWRSLSSFHSVIFQACMAEVRPCVVLDLY